MRGIAKSIKLFIGIVLITALHVGGAYVLPYPFAHINIIFAVILIVLLLSRSGFVVWMIFFSHYIIELYTIRTPFGIILGSSTMSMLLAFWLSRSVITSHSWYSGAVLSALALALYRITYAAILLLLQYLGYVPAILWSKLLVAFFWELFLTSMLVGMAFIILQHRGGRLASAKGRRIDALVS